MNLNRFVFGMSRSYRSGVRTFHIYILAVQLPMRSALSLSLHCAMRCVARCLNRVVYRRAICACACACVCMLACVLAGVGYWHSKNRYSTQQQITDAAAGFASRGINVRAHPPRHNQRLIFPVRSRCIVSRCIAFVLFRFQLCGNTSIATMSLNLTQ